MTFYCVMAEFFNGRYSGTNQAVKERVCKVKPKNAYKERPGMTAFDIWFDNEEEANELCEEIRTGDVGVYTLIEMFRKRSAA